MSPSQVIHNTEPTWDELLRASNEWVSEQLYCIRCRSALVSSLEPEGREWVIRCFSCRAKNVVVVSLRLVGWKL